MEGTKIFKSVYYMTESTSECQKAEKKGKTEISILGGFVALSKIFFTILSCELSFAFSRIPSRPVSVFRTESQFVPSCKNLSRHNTTIDFMVFLLKI